GRLAVRQAPENRPPGRIGEGREGVAQLVSRHLCSPVKLINRLIEYGIRSNGQSNEKEDAMGRIVVTEFVSLDGVMEDPGGSEDYRHGGWTFEIERGDEGNRFKLDETMDSAALLLGRRTYEGFAEAWPQREGEFA